MNLNTIKLNDLYQAILSRYNDYLYTTNKYILNDAVMSYYWYKKRGGKKVITRLEEELKKNNIQY